jgi:hypothetical protein
MLDLVLIGSFGLTHETVQVCWGGLLASFRYRCRCPSKRGLRGLPLARFFCQEPWRLPSCVLPKERGGNRFQTHAGRARKRGLSMRVEPTLYPGRGCTPVAARGRRSLGCIQRLGIWRMLARRCEQRGLGFIMSRVEKQTCCLSKQVR